MITLRIITIAFQIQVALITLLVVELSQWDK